jgi:hypothetical protein
MAPARLTFRAQLLDDGLFDDYEREYAEGRCSPKHSRSTVRLFTADVKGLARSQAWREAFEELIEQGVRCRKTSANRLVLLAIADETLARLTREQRLAGAGHPSARRR